MVFAAPSAMWLYCTGTVFRERERLLTTQKVREIEGNKANRGSEKYRKKEQGGELRKIIKSGEKKNKQTLRLSLYFLSCSPTLSPFLLVLHFQAWSPLKWMTA